MPFNPSVTAMRMSWQPRDLRSAEDLHPERGESVCSIQTRMSRLPSGVDAGEIDFFAFAPGFVADLHPEGVEEHAGYSGSSGRV